MKAMIRFALVVSLTGCLAACKAKVTADGGDFTPAKPAPFNHKVAGPSLDGVWVSGCVQDTFNNKYLTFTMILKDQDIQRIKTEYNDNVCADQAETYNYQGKYRFAAKYGDVYELEYRINVKGGTWDYGDNVRLVNGDRLWISDGRVGNGSIPDIELVKQ